MNTLTRAAIRSSLIFILTGFVYAGSAQWDFNPTSGDWNTAANWTPVTVPNGPAEIATFDLWNTTAVAISENTEVNVLVYTSAASVFTITVNPTLTWTLSGSGISNNSQVMQEFVAASAIAQNSEIDFTGSATPGARTHFTAQGGQSTAQVGGLIYFMDNASAGAGDFTAEAPNTRMAAFGGAIFFEDNATAASGHFTNFGSRAPHRDVSYGSTTFFDNSTAANAIFINKGSTASEGSGGQLSFHNQSTAAQGTFTNDGESQLRGISARTSFFDSSTADHGTFTNKPAVRRPSGLSGGTVFHDSSTASEGTFFALGATIFHNYGGFVEFTGNATAGNASFTVTGGINTAGGGSIRFLDGSDGGTAQVDVLATVPWISLFAKRPVSQSVPLKVTGFSI